MNKKIEISSLEDLLQKHFRGDQSAFEQFYKIMFNELYVYGAHIESSKPNLEDYIQSFLLKVYSSPKPYLNKEKTLSYLLKCFRNFIVKERLKELKIKESIQKEAELVEENSYFKIQLANEADNLVSFCNSMLSELGSKERELVYLKYYKGMKSVEIAGILGMNRQVVRNLIYRATLKLRKKYKHNEQMRASFEMIFNSLLMLIISIF